jgi:hypothetical protein
MGWTKRQTSIEETCEKEMLIVPKYGLILLCSCISTLKAQLLSRKPNVKHQNVAGYL